MSPAARTGQVVAAMESYRQLVAEAAEAFDRLRPRRRDLGGALIGSEARAPVDVAGILGALQVAAERMVLPSDLNKDGTPNTAATRERERVRRAAVDSPALAHGAPLLERLG